MECWVYILQSIKFGKYYIGQTKDLQKRLARHNAETGGYTARFMPWIIVWYCKKESRKEAMRLERKLKNLSRSRLESFMNKYSSTKFLLTGGALILIIQKLQIHFSNSVASNT